MTRTGIFIVVTSITFCHAFLGSNIFKTSDPRLFPIFCSDSIDSLDDISKETATHESITVDGIKMSVIELFRELKPEYVAPEQSASLSQIFQSFFGKCASPDRFLAAIYSIVEANIALDGQPGVKEDPSLHFDAEEFLFGQRELLVRNNQINTVAGDGKYATARVLLGRSLHSIQKFYAHSNWIENGNVEPADLIFGDIGVIAADGTSTCSNGSLITDEMTSGYFHYNIKPSDAQKCGHGSILDEGSIGGINKDTPSECFSPHYTYHKEAERLAKMATFDYMEIVRKTIQNNAFLSLLDLAYGSALAIAIDTSGSMGNEIEAVKAQVKEIMDAANSGGINPSVYLFAPYGTGQTVELTVTQDQEEVKRVLNSLHASGGNEIVFKALQSILSKAPEYTDILVYTDFGGLDPELTDSVISLAKAKKSKVNVIWTENNPNAPELDRTCKETGGLFIESSKTTVQDIIGLLSQSIDTSKATITSISDISSEANTEILVDSSIDKEGYRIGIRISGSIAEAFLHSPNDETIVNLFDNSSMIASGLSFEIVYIGAGLFDLSFVPNQEGVWTIDTTPSDEKPYKIEILAECSFSFVESFEILDLNSTHPSLQPIQGQPIATSTPYVNIRMTGIDKTKINSVDFVSFVTPDGNVLHKYEPIFRSGFEEDFIFSTEGYRMPNESFYIRIEGTDNRGNIFHRVKTSLISPATTYVEVTASSAKIEASPGETIEAEFTIYNFGNLPSNVKVEISDDLGYLVSDPIMILEIDEDDSVPFKTQFLVDSDAQVGDVSTIVVTATSLLDGTQNSALSSLVITSGVMDTTKPEYIILIEEECDDASSSESTCDLYSWSFTAIVSDYETGMKYVGVDFEGDAELNIDEFEIGTNDNISISFAASCCIRKAALSIIDVAGNPNRKDFFKGPFRNCSRLSVSDVSSSSLMAHWICPCSDWEGVDRYEMEFLASDGEIDYTHISRTKECDNSDIITKLRSCMTYDLNLTAYQIQPGTAFEQYRQIQATTLDSAPSGPTSVSFLNSTSTSIGLKWYPPIEHKECVFKYQVCYRILPPSAYSGRDSTKMDEICTETDAISSSDQVNEIELTGLEPCAKYRFRIAAVTKNGLVGEDTFYTYRTELEAPGEPTNFQPLKTDMNTIYLAWNKPDKKSWCVQRYVTSFYSVSEDYHSISKRSPDEYEDMVITDYDEVLDGTTMEDTTTESTAEPVTSTMASSTSTMSSSTFTTEDPFLNFDFIERISGLKYCTDYNLTIYSDGFNGAGSSITLSAEASTGLSSFMDHPTQVTVHEITDTTATITWFPPEQHFNCIDEYEVIWTNKANEDDVGGAKVGKNENKMKIGPLKPCSVYEISVRAWAQDIFGESKHITLNTNDNMPGPATNLRITNTFSDGFIASWCPAFIDPQCAYSWDWTTSEVEVSKFLSPFKEIGDGCQIVEERQLKCNSKYTLTVWAYSPTGMSGAKSQIGVITDPCS